VTQNQQLFINGICSAIVSGDFAMFSNPANCGVNFKWDEFADMMAARCRTDIFIYVKLTKKNTAEVQAHAELVGRRVATELLWRARTV
jgi:hypothetical protein